MVKPEDFAKFLRKAGDGFKITESEVLTDSIAAATTRFDTADELIGNARRKGIHDFFTNPPDDQFFLDNSQFNSFKDWLSTAKTLAGKERISRELGGD